MQLKYSSKQNYNPAHHFEQPLFVLEIQTVWSGITVSRSDFPHIFWQMIDMNRPTMPSNNT